MRSFFFTLIALGGLLLSACKQQNSDKLTIAAAANMQFAIEELEQTFTEQTGIVCQTIIGSSGKLTAQIKAGAPFDVFLSADMKYPNELLRTGHAIAAPKAYAYGQLVLWTLTDTLKPSMDLLETSGIRHIALANPKTAPYGVAALEVLKHHKLYTKINDKLVYGESISQTNQFILSQAADLGFTALSVVKSPKMKNKGHWILLDTANYSPIAQGVVLLSKHKNQLEEAQQFIEFLFSENGKVILEKFGYTVNKE